MLKQTYKIAVGSVRSSSPLANKLIRLIFGAYFALTLVITSVQIGFQYQDELKKIEGEIDTIVSLLMPVLSESLWTFDKKNVSAAFNALANNAVVVGVKLEGAMPMHVGAVKNHLDPIEVNRPIDESLQQAQNTLVTPRLYEQTYSVKLKQDSGNQSEVGRLHVYTSSNVVLVQSMEIMRVILISALVKSLVLWLILYLIIRSFVGLPITRIASSLNEIQNELIGKNAPALDFTGNRKKDDEMRFLFQSFILMRRALKRSQTSLLIHQENLEKKIEDRTKQLNHQAMHDELTGLLNRRGFEKEILTILCANIESEKPNVLCMIDLDHFKMVNDTFGHLEGDQLLKRFAQLMRSVVRSTDVIARMGGDEFAIVLFECEITEAQSIFLKMEKSMAGLVIEKDGVRVTVGISTGLLPFSTRTEKDLNRMMAEADAACYEAKTGGRHHAVVFNANFPARRRSDIDWLGQINNALAENQFVLHAQPIFFSDSDEIRVIEILLRIDLAGELISPARFMSTVERYGLSIKIDEWVVSHTFEFLATNKKFLNSMDSIHINLSGAAISDARFYRFMVQEFRRYAIPFEKICFEVTEGMPLNLDYASRIMNGLRERGTSFALDDFGCGMASYYYLQKLPVNIVKIDGSFVRDVITNPVSQAIVKSVNDIAHLAGKVTVAEYVENAAIADKLREMEIDYLQGYYLGKPTALANFLRRGSDEASII